jgi:hypothetical protein
MEETRRIKKDDLKPGGSKISEGGTKVIHLINDGVDDKFSFVAVVRDLQGDTHSAEIWNRLNRGERKEIDISQYSVKIVRVSIMWRDVNGIGRYTCTKQCENGKFFLSISSWWIASTETVEENLIYGSEAFT